jgi:hypothetical protein
LRSLGFFAFRLVHAELLSESENPNQGHSVEPRLDNKV